MGKRCQCATTPSSPRGGSLRGPFSPPGEEALQLWDPCLQHDEPLTSLVAKTEKSLPIEERPNRCKFLLGLEILQQARRLEGRPMPFPLPDVELVLNILRDGSAG